MYNKLDISLIRSYFYWPKKLGQFGPIYWFGVGWSESGKLQWGFNLNKLHHHVDNRNHSFQLAIAPALS